MQGKEKRYLKWDNETIVCSCPEQKVNILREVLEEGKTMSEVATKYEIHN